MEKKKKSGHEVASGWPLVSKVGLSRFIADCCRVLYVEDETLSETCLAGILLKSKKQGDGQRRSETVKDGSNLEKGVSHLLR